MHHHAAVARGPSRRVRRLRTDESVFDAETVTRERLRVEQVTELLVERRIAVLGDGQ
jgi:hypothetical protein